MACYERHFEQQTQRQLLKASGQTKCGNPGCDWSFWPYYDAVEMQRPGIAPKEGISEEWLCQSCFEIAAKAVEHSIL